jgi:hypothetical protein
MANFIGLYYPLIQFKSEPWLKTMALYWDGIKRIVPSGHQLQDSDTIKKLVASGLIQDVQPERNEDWPAVDRFVRFLIENAEQLRSRYGIEHLRNWPDDPITVQRGPDGADKRLAYVHSTKLSEAMKGTLGKTCLTLAGQEKDETWVAMHPKLAHVYMTVLAEQMTNGRGWHPVTDETVDQLAVSGFSIERLARALLDDVTLASEAPAAQEPSVALANLCFKNIIPQGVENVPVEKIIQLRKDHQTEFKAYQDSLAAFRHEILHLGGVNDPAALTEHLNNEYNCTIGPSLAKVRQAFEWKHMETATSIVNVQFAAPPVLAAAVTWAGVAVNPVLAGVAGVALGVIPAIQKRRDEAQDQLDKPGAWLLRIQEGLTPQSFMAKVQQRARKFAFGV